MQTSKKQHDESDEQMGLMTEAIYYADLSAVTADIPPFRVVVKHIGALPQIGDDVVFHRIVYSPTGEDIGEGSYRVKVRHISWCIDATRGSYVELSGVNDDEIDDDDDEKYDDPMYEGAENGLLTRVIIDCR